MDVVQPDKKKINPESVERTWIDRYLLAPACSETMLLGLYAGFCLFMIVFSIVMETSMDLQLLDEIQVLLIPPIIYTAISFYTRLYLYLIPLALFTCVFNMWVSIDNPTQNIQLAISSALITLVIGELIFRAASRQRILQIQKEALAEELQNSLDRIKRLSEILPICKVCNELRTDEKAWQEFEHFLNEELSVEIVKGICPTCIKKMVSEIQIDDQDLGA